MSAHNYSDKWSSDADNHWHVCTVCSAEDDFSAHVPDREQPGEDSPVKCTVCGYVIEPATGHIIHTAGDTWYSDGTSHWQTCTGCGIKMNEASHSGGSATCTDKAQCAVCGKEYGELAAHSPVTMPDVPPTCTQTGLTQGQKCSVCGEILVKQEIVPANGHTSEIIPGKAATCTQTGLTEGIKCSVCGVILKEQTVIAKLEHKPVTIPAVESTCMTSGLTAGQKCSVCGVILVEQQVIPANGHTVVIDEAVKPTCTETGLTEGKHCSVCGETLVKQEELSANGHSYESSVTKQPTCTEKGVRTYTCSVCGDSYTEDIAANGHTIVVDKAVEPTCTVPGLTEGKHCSVCGEILVKQEEISANGHSYESSVTKQPTCTEKGLRTFTCSACGDSYTEDIEANGHTIVIDEAVEPTCTETGLTEGRRCSVCGAVIVKQEVIAANGHTEVIDKAVEPTCTDTGLTEGKHCSVCGETLIAQKTIPANGHEWSAWTTIKDPTCTTTGQKQRICSVCNETETTNIAANGHSYGSWKTIRTATCSQTGLQERTCSVCDYVQQQTIAKTSHSYGAWQYDDTYHWRSCTRCGYTTSKTYHTKSNGKCLTCGYRVPSNGLAFELNSAGTAYSVAGIGTCTDRDILIPSTHNGLPVSSIQNRAFATAIARDKMDSIVIPSSIQSIGEYAFAETSLRSVTIEGNPSLGAYIFYDCRYLTTVNLSNSLTTIGELMFFACDSLQRITIPNSVTVIKSSAFQSCDNLSYVFLGSNVERIESSAFIHCESLNSIFLPNKLKTIQSMAFFNTGLTSITIPNSVTFLGPGVFRDCTNLTRVVFEKTDGWVEDSIIDEDIAASEIADPSGMAKSMSDGKYQYSTIKQK